MAGINCRRVSVTRRFCIKTVKRMITQTTPRDSPGTLVFCPQQSLVDEPPPPEICAQRDPPTPFRTPISAHSASTVRTGEKSLTSTYSKLITKTDHEFNT